jgi:outer membrane protein TolC
MTWVGRALIFVVAFAPCSTLRAQAAPDIRQARAWTLEEAVAAALAQHPLVEAARARLDAAHAERAGASALANPVGTLWLENVGYPGQRASAGARESSLYVTYPLESLVQRGPRINRADQDVNAAQASLAVARRAVAAETVQYFFAVALAQALQEEADENRDRLEQLVAYNRVRAEAGVTAEGELLRLEVELDRARNDVVFAGVELMKQQSRLAPYPSRLPPRRTSSRRAGAPASRGATPRRSSSRRGRPTTARARR